MLVMQLLTSRWQLGWVWMLEVSLIEITAERAATNEAVDLVAAGRRGSTPQTPTSGL
jgi:hypothetical protein